MSARTTVAYSMDLESYRRRGDALSYLLLKLHRPSTVDHCSMQVVWPNAVAEDPVPDCHARQMRCGKDFGSPPYKRETRKSFQKDSLVVRQCQTPGLQFWGVSNPHVLGKQCVRCNVDCTKDSSWMITGLNPDAQRVASGGILAFATI